ncbi:hypothetical protein GCM10027275_25130 [Rhabdobacter roseus]|uniref:DUF4494 domain-containing protein n=1 Tax=Rhabdobacter roseus TaxID=1655419 RepID=A0A840TT57_9BACT|nr:DUF4494 domain-containing protein [Rhabdobacter roseus]MBB5284453.1 hypothetical protein [Rhabdobacter roseus]
MATWHLGKIAYMKEDETGRLKQIREAHLIDAMSFTEAEARLIELLTEELETSFEVKTLTPFPLTDVFGLDDDVVMGDENTVWYQVKASYQTVDERTGKTKRTANNFLVYASSVRDAYDALSMALRGFLLPYEIEAIRRTSILTVRPYAATN